MTFTGFPVAALDFYDDLELDNTKAFWEAHKEIYSSAVAEPMRALVDELADDFGAAKIFRPYRDVRFSKEKTPYKTHQGAFFAHAPATGYYLQIGAPGVRVAAGFYRADSARLADVRAAIGNDVHGADLQHILRTLETQDWEIGGETLKTAPRGWPADHPRIHLLRHKAITATKDYGFAEIIHSPDLVGRVHADWRAASPLVDWVVAHAGN